MKNHKLLKTILVVVLFFFCPVMQIAVAEEQLIKTPEDYEGPFYPVSRQQDIDNDLIHVTGQAGVAEGDILNLSGLVVNTGGEAQKDIIIEIWQTDPQGRYKHPGDSTPGERDPNFQYWGAAITDNAGAFFFKTIIPGAYTPRPAHIHFKVLQDGKVILTSQVYFRERNERIRRPSMTSKIELQTTDLKATGDGEFEAFFRIVI
jgi:protocatechuate 3,4-dioxygenase beta subunit